MKMKKEHFEALKQRISIFTNDIPAYIKAVQKGGVYSNLEKRIIWNIFYSTKMYELYSPQEFDYNDSHIETAVRKALKELGYDIKELTKGN